MAAPADPAAFGKEMQARIEQLYPDAKLKPKDDLSVQLSFPGREPLTMNFDRVFGFCQTATPEDCEGQMQQFAQAVREVAVPPKIAKERLRLIVRGSDYLAGIATHLGAAGNPAPIQRPLADGIGLLLMADYPDTSATVSASDLSTLRIGEDEAIALGQAQVLSRLPEIPLATELRKGPIALQAEYVESLLLNAAGWARLDAETRGALFVAVPGANLLIVGAAPDTELSDIAELTASLAAESPRPISTLVYRWRDGGWKATSAPAAK